MANGLIDLITPRLPTLNEKATSKELSKSMDTNKLYDWIKVCDMREEVGTNVQHNNVGSGSDLQVNGESANIKFEKKIDRYFLIESAAACINRNIK